MISYSEELHYTQYHTSVVVPVMRKGLALLQEFWRRVERVPDFPVYVDRENRAIRGLIPYADRYYILDANVVTGRTIGIVEKYIKAKVNPYADVVKVGTARSDLAERVLDIVLREDYVMVDKYAVFVCGYPLSGKSMIARMLSYYDGFRYYKWAKYLPPSVGLYGEALAKIEQVDVFYPAKYFVRKSGILEDTSKYVVIDGVKRVEHIEYVSYICRRPAIIVWISIGSELRNYLLTCRNDPDDKYDSERIKLFKDPLERIYKYAHVCLYLDTLDGVNDLLGLLGVNGVGTKYKIPCPTKEVFLDILVHEVVEKDRIYRPLFEVETSRSYARKLEMIGVNDRRLHEHVENIRRGFKVVDDIIDEDSIRDHEPSHWVRYGVVKALLTGIAYLQIARNEARKLGIYEHFVNMLMSVVDAVRYEIRVEEGKVSNITWELWFKVAEREAEFRRYLALISGRYDLQWNMYLDGLRAQAVDDVLGLNKEGRLGMEIKLNRPLITRIINIDRKSILEVSRELKEIVREHTISSKDEAKRIFASTIYKYVKRDKV